MKRKGMVMYRKIDDLPDIPLALDNVQTFNRGEKVVLVSIEDDDVFFEVLTSPKGMTIVVFDPHETLDDDGREYAD